MDCWQVLGIESGSDKKTIKIAYAKALKKTRPDEDPEGFKSLHSAYKAALNWDDYYDDEPSFDATAELLEPTLPASSEADFELAAKKEHSKEELQLLEDIRQQEEVLSDSWESFRQQVNALVMDHKATNKIESWAFLETMPAMRDLEFRKSAADSLFEVVSELNEESLQKKSLYIKRPVINYLNNLYGWDKSWQEYEYRYSREMLDAVFPYLAETEKVVKGVRSNRELHYYRRIAAFAIDVLILMVTGYLVNAAEAYFSAESGSHNATWVLSWVFFYALVLIPVQECSRYQATIGKHFMNLQVIDSKGERINFFHAFGRSLATVICCGLFKIVLWVNILLSWWKNQLLQDILSRSYVTMRPK